ncbi:MAG: hypothetical protein ACI4UT_03115 [Candidatus Enteromonas sp.]
MKLSLDNREIFLQTIKDLEEQIGRTIVFAYLQGSQNYDLETPASDMDGKAFCLPSLDDLYDGSFLSKTFDYPCGQITIHDVRMLPDLLEKMNPTYLESFFSYEQFFFKDDMKPFLSPDAFNNLFLARKPILLRSILGTFRTKVAEIHHPSTIRVPVIEKYGYDIKSASHALRLAHLFFCIINEPHGDPYSLYRKALRLSGEAKEVILDVKLGQYREKVITPWLKRADEFLSAQVDLFAKEKATSSLISKRMKEAALPMIAEDFRLRLSQNKPE